MTCAVAAAALFSGFFILRLVTWQGSTELHTLMETFAAALTMGCFLLFGLVPLPTAYHGDPFFPRPQELIPAVFFLLALIGYLRNGS